MVILKLKNKTDNSITEIIAFNIDNENNILIKEDDKIDFISLETFKDMMLGTSGNNQNNAQEASH